MRTPQEIQADIKAHHEQARAKSVPVHFLTLATLQAEFNESVLASLAADGVSAEQKAFNDKVSEALFNEPAASSSDAPDPSALVVPPAVTNTAQ